MNINTKFHCIRIESIRKFFLFLGLFFLIFPPYVKVSGFTLKTVYIFAGIPAIIGAIKFKKNINFNPVAKDILFAMAIAMAYLLFLSMLGGYQDLSTIYQLIMGFILFFACYNYTTVYNNFYQPSFLLSLLKQLNLVGVLHSVILILTFLSPGFKDFLYSFIAVSEKSAKYLFGESLGFRFQGIVPSGFSYLSTTHAMLLVIGLWAYYLDDKKYTRLHLFLFIAGQIAIFLSLVLIGRTGFMILLLFVIALLIIRLSKFLVNMRSGKKTLRLLTPLIFLVLLIAFSIDYDRYARNLSFAFEYYYNYLETGKFSSKSTDQLIENEFFLPEEPLNLLFGTSNFGRGEDYVYSDIGYVLFIHGAGIIGMLIAFSFYFVAVFHAFRYRKQNMDMFLFIFLTFITLCILNLKDYYFIDYSGFNQIIFLLAFSVGIKQGIPVCGGGKYQKRQYYSDLTHGDINSA